MHIVEVVEVVVYEEVAGIIQGNSEGWRGVAVLRTDI